MVLLIFFHKENDGGCFLVRRGNKPEINSSSSITLHVAQRGVREVRLFTSSQEACSLGGNEFLGLLRISPLQPATTENEGTTFLD